MPKSPELRIETIRAVFGRPKLTREERDALADIVQEISDDGYMEGAVHQGEIDDEQNAQEFER